MERDAERDFRLVFDTIPEQFDRWRCRYTPALFAHLIAAAKVNAQSTVLELGPGTGQATEPILAAGCRYTAIELGDNFAQILRKKYGSLPHFHLIHIVKNLLNAFMAPRRRKPRFACGSSSPSVDHAGWRPSAVLWWQGPKGNRFSTTRSFNGTVLRPSAIWRRYLERQMIRPRVRS